MHFETSPGSSPSKSIPISISPRNMASPTGSVYSNYSSESNSSRGSSCAYPSWPTGPSLEYRSTPSSYISDADLFGEDFDDEFSCPFLQEAPAPPRVPPMAQAFPVLPPLYAPKKPKSERRRSSGRKQRRTSKPMTPISESPEQVE
ncbi:Nn.00g015700.m01.CDS01 [Neocucurbitaria sp. VM-36]